METEVSKRGGIQMIAIMDSKSPEPEIKKTGKLFHPQNTVIKVDNAIVGGNNIAIIAGPCSVESEEQIISIAESVKKSGATFLRGGAYKPRTSPYSFQGMQEDGLKLLGMAKEKTGLPIVTELMSTQEIDRVAEYADVIQIGAKKYAKL